MKTPLIAAIMLAALAARAVPAGNEAGVTYTISREEALAGPKPDDPNYVIDSGACEATIAVDAGKVRARVNPLVFGACLEDLNHEVFFDNHRVWLQPHAWSIRMAREHYQPLAVEASVTCPKMTFKNPVPYGVPVVDVLVAGAARSEKGGILALKVVNFAPFALKTTLHIAGIVKLAPKAKTVWLTGDSLKLENTADQPSRVEPAAGARDGIAPEFVHVFPAFSYTILDMTGER